MFKSMSKLKAAPFFSGFKRKGAFFLQASNRRATIEFLASFWLFTAILLILQTGRNSLNIAVIFSLLIAVSWATIRLKLTQNVGFKVTFLELLTLIRFGLVCCGVWSFFFSYTLSFNPSNIYYFPNSSDPQAAYFNTLAGLFVILVLFFVLFRGVLYLWAWLDIRQRRHLRWALTYAHFKLAIGLIFIVYFAYLFLSFGLNGVGVQILGSQKDDINFFFYFSFSLIILLVLLGILTLLVIAPVFIIFSYLAMKPNIRKLEVLASATRQLQEGNYSTRIEVAGEDEIAQLQENFNQMAGKLEETLHQLQVERDTVKGLLQSNRELVASVSHELRTPVAAVRGYLEALLSWDKNEAPPTLQHDLAVIQRETLHLQTLIEDLFLLSRAEVGRLTLNIKNADPTPLIQRTVEAAAPLAWHNRKVQVLSNLPPQLPKVRLDETRLEQILSNLIQNAIRHTPPGGLIIVTAQPHAGGLELAVRDTGEGIAEADLPYIWQRFYKADLTGTGLGLAIVKELTEALGGTVEVESELGKGSSFKINLALASSLN